MRILLVDDHPAFLRSLQLLLELNGHEIVTSPHATAALNLLSAGERVDLVITDDRMPGICGNEFIKQTIQLLGPLVPPFILHSSLHDEPTKPEPKPIWYATIPKGNSDELLHCLSFLAESAQNSDA
jgi:CheY-like chemotaxis protein